MVTGGKAVGGQALTYSLLTENRAAVFGIQRTENRKDSLRINPRVETVSHPTRRMADAEPVVAPTLRPKHGVQETANQIRRHLRVTHSSDCDCDFGLARLNNMRSQRHEVLNTSYVVVDVEAALPHVRVHHPEPARRTGYRRPT